MSTTAQRKIFRPAGNLRLAHLVGNQTRLDYLYVPTVADINATNPSLWNSCQPAASALYRNQARWSRGLENPLDREEQIRLTQSAALICARRHDADVAEHLWSQAGR
jgi:[protein-PII] uridylyltransferase